jgi:hypothetical protein
MEISCGMIRGQADSKENSNIHPETGRQQLRRRHQHLISILFGRTK